jgi:single-stranded DNA-binding protein
VLQFLFRLSKPEERNPITIVAIGKLAEIEPDLLQRGQVLTVKGRLKQRRWQTPEGRQRSRVEIIATDFQRPEDSHLNPVAHKRGVDDNDHEKTI